MLSAVPPWHFQTWPEHTSLNVSRTLSRVSRKDLHASRRGSLRWWMCMLSLNNLLCCLFYNPPAVDILLEKLTACTKSRPKCLIRLLNARDLPRPRCRQRLERLLLRRSHERGSQALSWLVQFHIQHYSMNRLRAAGWRGQRKMAIAWLIIVDAEQSL